MKEMQKPARNMRTEFEKAFKQFQHEFYTARGIEERLYAFPGVRFCKVYPCGMNLDLKPGEIEIAIAPERKWLFFPQLDYPALREYLEEQLPVPALFHLRRATAKDEFDEFAASVNDLKASISRAWEKTIEDLRTMIYKLMRRITG